MKRQLSAILGLAGIVSLLVGCSSGSDTGAGENPTTPKIQALSLSGQEFGVLSGDITAVEGGVSGTGLLVAKSPLTELSNNYALQFTLAEDSSVSLIANAEQGLKSPVVLTFSRLENGKLNIDLVDGSSVYEGLQADFEDEYGYVPDATNTISVEVDVHDHPHTVIWIDGNELNLSYTSKLSGTLWGLELENAVVLEARRGAAKDNHGH